MGMQTFRDGRAVMTWELPGDDTPFDLSRWSARSVQVTGQFSGGRVDLEGTNDGEIFHILSDPNGNPLSFRSPKIESILEECMKIAPKLVGPPDANVKISVLLFPVVR
jgi:hypothetical protein